MAVITVVITTKGDALPVSLVNESKNFVNWAFKMWSVSVPSNVASGTHCTIELEKKNSAGDKLNVTVSPNL